MSVYQRPLFRQMGGPVAPGMAAQQAMAPAAGGQDPAAMLQQVETQTAQQAQGVGAQYAQNLMSGIDAAETPEQIINALRGNALPMDQRYAELAQFVGEADAKRTPESVLALVQPTIMMTEEGFMDSGVGELMKNFLGSVEMETEAGEPTPMGQGVGSLMMAGAAAAPDTGVGQQPVANFNQGGVVQRFQTGGEASRLQSLYSEMLPVYQSILGDGEEQRRMTQAQILFDIADRAGAFAAGIDPRSGQSIARLSPAAQLAAAASGLGGQIGQRLGSQEEQDRALRLAALQAAQGEFSAERADQRAAARAAAAAGRDRGVGTFYDLRDSEGNVVRRVPISTRAEMDQLIAEATEIGGDFRPTQFEATGLTDEDYFSKFGMTRAAFEALPVADQRRLLNLDTEAGLTDEDYFSKFGMTRAAFEALPVADQRRLLDLTPEATAPDIRSVQVGTGPVQNFDVSTAGGADAFRTASQQPGARIVTDSAARTADPLVNPDIMSAYAAGTLSPAEEARVQAAIAENTRMVFNPQTGRNERPTITPIVSQAERARRDAGLSTVITFPEDEPTVANVEEGLTRLEEFGGEAFGTAAAATNFANRLFALVDANAPFPERQEGINLVNTLNETATLAFRDMTTGRPAQDAVNQFATLSPTTATITGSPSSAASQIRALLDLWNREMAQSETALRSGILSQSDRTTVEAGIEASRGMIEAYHALLRGLERAGGGSGVDPSQFRR